MDREAPNHDVLAQTMSRAVLLAVFCIALGCTESRGPILSMATDAYEECGDEIDNDGDGAIDEGCACGDLPSRACGTPLVEGICQPGVQPCHEGVWGGCVGAIGPGPELCGDMLDNDCDGLTDEGCECLPSPELCADGVDNDCDGETDEANCTGFSCPAPGVRVIEIAAGPDHICALIADGRVFCWGDNTLGSLGLGEGAAPERILSVELVPGSGTTPVTLDRGYSPRALEVPGITAASTLAASPLGATCVVDNGQLRCFGPDRDTNYDLDSGLFSDIRWVPTVEPEALPLTGLLGVSTSESAVFVQNAAGELFSWGNGGQGILGRQSYQTWAEGDPAVSVDVPLAIAVDAFHWSACSVHTGGAIFCWGWNRDGQAGEQLMSSYYQTTPLEIMGISDAVDVKLGRSHSCALRAGGQVACWGADGRRGDGLTGETLWPHISTASAVVGLDNAVAVDASRDATCALRADGSIYCWGYSTTGPRLLSGSTSAGPREPLNLPAPLQADEIGVDIALSELETLDGVLLSNLCVLDGCGRVRCMGRNNLGQLGDGTTDDSTTFTEVLGLP